MSRAVLRTKTRGNVFLLCMSEGELPEAEFGAFVETLRDPTITKVVSAGMGRIKPTPTQRKLATDVIKERENLALGLIADDPFVRGIITVLTWLGLADLKSFPWDETASAFAHLDVPPDEIERHVQELSRLRGEIERATTS